MSFDPQQPSLYVQPTFQQSRRSGGGWLIGLLLMGFGVIFVGGAICIGGVWYITSNVDRWLAGLGREAIVAMIQESDIPEQEKTEVITQVDRVVNAYKERKINQDDLQRVLTQLEESPAVKIIPLYGLDDVYLEDSGLSEDEVAKARRTFQRVFRGVYEGKISEEAFFAALPDDNEFPTGDPDDNGAKLNLKITPASAPAGGVVAADSLRESLAKLDVMVTNARIPDEPFELDIGDEVKKAVDKALAGKAAK
jgi:hypothetical protein